LFSRRLGNRKFIYIFQSFIGAYKRFRNVLKRNALKKKKIEKRPCLNCGELFSGRPDKKYCSPECKNDYHNDKSKAEEGIKEINRITNILRKNRKILKEILGDGKGKKEKKDIMMRKGFSFDYITQTQGSYRYCFEYGYTNSKDDYYFIVKGFDKIVNKE
jgi:hypothetical protein